MKDFPECLDGAYKNAREHGRKQIVLGCHPKIIGPWAFCEPVIKAIITLITLAGARETGGEKGRLSS